MDWELPSAIDDSPAGLTYICQPGHANGSMYPINVLDRSWSDRQIQISSKCLGVFVKTKLRFANALALLSLLAAGLTAQTFRGSISGSVVDSSGAAVPDTIIRLVNDSTGFNRETTTTATGAFNMPDLPLGFYTLTFTKTGFQTTKVDKVEVAVSRVTNLPVTLAVSSQATTVEISATAAAIETSSTTLANVVNPQMVQDMPMNGRDFRQMLKMAPGVNPLNNSVNGNRTSGNNYQIDGADNNDAFHNTSAVNQGGVAGIAGTLLPVEAIDQFAIASNASAESGRNGGSNVNLVIKSGTNELHGSAYYFNRREALASLTPFQVPGSKKRVIRNDQYGFSLGGPVIKNKLFYFMTGEAQDAIAAISLLSTHPSTAFVEQARGLLRRYDVAESPLASRVLTAWPSRYNGLPATANNLAASDQNVYDSYNGIIKVDYNINDRHTIATRYYGGTGKQAASSGSVYQEYFQVAPSRMHNVSVVANSTLSPRMFNNLILGANYFLQVFNDKDTSFNPVALGFNTDVTEASLIGTPSLRITNFAGAGFTQPLGRIDSTGHITDNLSYTVGRHQLKFGGEYRRAVLDVFYDTNKRGSFTWDGSAGPWRGDTSVSAQVRSLADFMAMTTTANNGATITRGQLQRDYRQNSFDWWIHDNFQVNRRLNLNFGVRYTFHGVLYDIDRTITNFIPGRGFVTPGKDIDRLYPNDLNNFAPRFGFAYQPFASGKTVVRGSWGIFYDVPPLNFIVANTGSGNGGAAGVHANPGGPEPVFNINLTGAPTQIAAGQSIFGSAAPRPPFGAYAINQDFRIPYVQNYNLNIQQQLGGGTILQTGYVASTGRKLSLLRNINAPTPGTTGALQTRRPFNSEYPTIAAINTLESIGNSQYHSWQSSIRVTRWKNLMINGNYTWSRQMDNGTTVRNALPTNSYNLRQEYGPGEIDLRHIVTGYVAYDLPVFTSRAKLLTQGWQFGNLFQATTGTPLNITAGVNRSNSFDNRDRVDVVGTAIVGVQEPANAGGSRRYFNADAFALPAIGTFGNIGRNALRGPGFAAVDFSIFKRTPITERIKTEFRVEIFNLFNRSNFANPGTNFNAATSFGLITNTRNGSGAPGLGQGEPRNIQLALKLIW